jgi:flagellin-like hook-associated protein FlgL
LQTFTLLRQLQQNSVRLFEEQQRLSSGEQLLTVSEDPIAGAKLTRLEQSLRGQEQILGNLRHADAQLAAADSALADISDLLIEAARIASEQAGSLQSADERASMAVVVDGLIDQLLNVGNRQFQGSYLFGGREVDSAPLNTLLGRVTNLGDNGERRTLVERDTTLAFNVNAAEIFDLRESVAGATVDFDVQLSTQTRVSELAGATLAGVRLGPIEITQAGPALNFMVDFTGAETVGDLIARFNDAAATAGSTLTLGINPADGATLRITSGPGISVTVSEVGSGTTATDLGIRQSVGAGVDLVGDNLHRLVALTTQIGDLAAGGLSLTSGVQIKNGSLSATVSFAGATTVQDVLNALNGAGVGIRASIDPTGNGIEIENLIAGSPLLIGENGGTDAAQLGIKTLDGTAPLSRLNGGLGIHPVSGNDIRITNANGVSFEVDLSGAQTVGDALNRINSASAAAGAGVAAAINQAGGGIELTGPAGPGALVVESVNLSAVAGELGLLKTGTATLLEGDNVGAFVQSGVFSALYRLRDGLLADDSIDITEAGAAVQALQRHVAGMAGQVGGRARAMQARLTQTEDAVTATTILLSELRDVDFTEAVTKFQQAQTALQAALLAGSQNQNLSLLDFLR